MAPRVSGAEKPRHSPRLQFQLVVLDIVLFFQHVEKLGWGQGGHVGFREPLFVTCEQIGSFDAFGAARDEKVFEVWP